MKELQRELKIHLFSKWLQNKASQCHYIRKKADLLYYGTIKRNMRGRPKLSFHDCKNCYRKFDRAKKKVDHQRWCKDIKVESLLQIKKTWTLTKQGFQNIKSQHSLIFRLNHQYSVGRKLRFEISPCVCGTLHQTRWSGTAQPDENNFCVMLVYFFHYF